MFIFSLSQTLKSRSVYTVYVYVVLVTGRVLVVSGGYGVVTGGSTGSALLRDAWRSSIQKKTAVVAQMRRKNRKKR